MLTCKRDGVKSRSATSRCILCSPQFLTGCSFPFRRFTVRQKTNHLSKDNRGVAEDSLYGVCPISNGMNPASLRLPNFRNDTGSHLNGS